MDHENPLVRTYAFGVHGESHVTKGRCAGEVEMSQARHGAHAALAGFVGSVKRHVARVNELEWMC